MVGVAGRSIACHTCKQRKIRVCFSIIIHLQVNIACTHLALSYSALGKSPPAVIAPSRAAHAQVISEATHSSCLNIRFLIALNCLRVQVSQLMNMTLPQYSGHAGRKPLAPKASPFRLRSAMSTQVSPTLLFSSPYLHAMSSEISSLLYSSTTNTRQTLSTTLFPIPTANGSFG